MKKTWIWSIALLIASQSFAMTYDYHPKSRLYLGGGYNPFQPGDAMQVCLSNKGTDNVDSEGSVFTQVKMIRVRSQKEYFSETQFSASIEGSYAFLSGGGAVSLETADAFQSDAFTWLILFRSNYGRVVLKDPVLKNEYKGLTEKELEERCGTEVVTEATRAVAAYALFTVKNVSSSQMRKFDESFHASANGVFWSVDLNQKYSSFMKMALANNQVQFRLEAVGGDGIGKLADLLESTASPNEDPYSKFYRIPQVLQQYLKTQVKEKSAPVTFNTQKIQYFTASNQSIFPRFKTELVEQLYFRFERAIGIVSRLESILLGNDSAEYRLSSTQRENLKAAYNSYIEMVNNLAKAGASCFDVLRQDDCKLPMDNAPLIDWPKQANDCERLRQRALDLRLVTRDQYQAAVIRDFVPVFTLENSKVVIYEWEKCIE